MPAIKPYVIGIPVYPGVDLLDVSAPYEVFNWMAETWKSPRPVRVYLVAEVNGPVSTRDGLQLVPHRTFDQLPELDVLWVPGGSPEALKVRMADEVLLDRLRTWSRGAAYVTSVCEGALLLAAAGLLDGYRVTTHWAFIPCLKQFPGIKEVVGGADGYPRFVVDPPRPTRRSRGVRVTGAGVSAGLDEALKLVELISGTAVAQAVQQTIQYFPDPPVHGTLPVATVCPV